MSNCSSGCRTKNHSSYGECLRSNTPAVQLPQVGAEYMARKKWDAEIREYRSAQAQGIQPKSSKLKDIRSAVNRSRNADMAVKEA